MRPPLRDEAGREGPVLVVQTAFIGDTVLTTPLLAALRERLPGRPITLLTTPDGAAILAGHPAVDDFILYDKRAAGGAWRRFRETLREVRARRFALAIAPHLSARTTLLIRLAGVPRRVGMHDARLAFLYTDRVRRDRSLHEAERDLLLAAPFGDPIPPGARAPSLVVAPERRARVRDLLKARGVQGDYFCCAPGSVWATKRWLPERYAEAMNAASARYGIPGVLIGGPGDREVGSEVARRLSGFRSADLIGRTPLEDLPALIAGARFLLTNDSSPMHVATAVGAPVVAVFGPTDRSLGFTPYGGPARVVEHPDMPCRPCGRHGHATCPQGHFRCMREIEAADVLAALEDLLGE